MPRALLLLGLVACELAPPDSGTKRLCEDSGDCPSGLMCAGGPGWCYDPSPIKVPVAVQLIPPTGGDLVVDQRTSVVFWDKNQFSASLKPAVVVKGHIHDLGNKLPHNLPAQVVALTDGDVPGTTLRTEIEAGSGLKDGGVGFTLPVIADRLYVVSIYPKDSERPVHHLLRKFQEADAGLDVPLPALADYPVVCGRLISSRDLNKDGVLDDPLVGVRVQAVEVRPPEDDSPLPLRTSTTALTQPDMPEDPEGKCEPGYFKLRFPAEPLEYALQLEPAGESATAMGITPAVIPKLVVDPTLQTIKISGAPGEVAPSLQTISVVTTPPVTARVEVRGSEGLASDVPIKGATLTLRGEVDQGLFTAIGTTDEDGVWTGPMIPGTYDLQVVPPKDGPYAAHKQTVDVGEETVKVVTGRRTLLEGTVVGYDGRPVSGVAVRALKSSAAQAPSEVNPSIDQQYTTKTDDAGAFLLWVDPGSYAFLLTPPPEVGYPRYVNRKVSEVKGGSMSMGFVLPVPHLVRGVITTSEGEPVPGVTIEFYEQDGEVTGMDGAAAPAAYLDQLHLLGVGNTDESGAYQALVPVESP